MPIFEEPIKTNKKILLTDSRFLSDSEFSIFFAIKGQRHNGHQFIEMLYEKGVREFVIESKIFENDISLQEFCQREDVKIWLVKNSIRALQNLAAENRFKFQYPVVGITGSNGKTIVKEWLSTILDEDINIVKSPRSYNSQIGVALSVWEMTQKDELGIFEAGISLPDEMDALQKIINPEVGIFTNIGTAHNEGFKSSKQKILEKLRLFKNAKFLVYSKDYSNIDEEITILLKAVNPNLRLIGWSLKDSEKYRVKAEILSLNSIVSLDFNEKKYTFNLPFIDAASIENAIHCAYTALILKQNYFKNLDIIEVFERFNQLKPIAMRLELKQGTNDNYIIDDTYNNDLGGLKMAFNFMSQHHTRRGKVLIVSDILQSGLAENDLYLYLSELIKSQNLELLIGIGTKFIQYQNHFRNCSVKQPLFFENTDDFLKYYNFEALANSLILVKGARSFGFEKIVNRLIMKVHGTVLEINLDAITHNLNFYRSKVAAKTQIMAMVKAFAYGSGSTEVASWLQYHRVNYLSVAYPDEGVVLRENGIVLPIMVLNSDPETLYKVFENNLEPEIYSLRTLKAYLEIKNLSFSDFSTKIHIKLDTGMNRLGFVENDIDEMIDLILKQPKLRIASIFSHLVGSDEEEHIQFSNYQIQKFTELSSKIIDKIGYSPLRHICNSAGILRFPEDHFDMVRLGIGLYGVDPSGIGGNALETVGTLKTTISQIKTLKAGDTVGYSRKGVIEKETKIATLAIGYADGFDRGFSRGNATVNINGVFCPTVGNVCMDMTMVDVTNVACNEGDEVIIFGENPKVYDLAQKINTISYEILTGISERVKRVFIINKKNTLKIF